METMKIMNNEQVASLWADKNVTLNTESSFNVPKAWQELLPNLPRSHSLRDYDWCSLDFPLPSATLYLCFAFNVILYAGENGHIWGTSLNWHKEQSTMTRQRLESTNKSMIQLLRSSCPSNLIIIWSPGIFSHKGILMSTSLTIKDNIFRFLFIKFWTYKNVCKHHGNDRRHTVT